MKDLLRGEIAFDNITLEDYIIVKSDGWALYHLAYVTDAAARVVYTLDAQGRIVSQAGEGHLSDPWGVAVDSTGAVPWKTDENRARRRPSATQGRYGRRGFKCVATKRESIVDLSLNRRLGLP